MEIAVLSVKVITTLSVVHQVLFAIVTLLQVSYNILASQFYFYQMKIEIFTVFSISLKR